MGNWGYWMEKLKLALKGPLYPWGLAPFATPKATCRGWSFQNAYFLKRLLTVISVYGPAWLWM